MILVAGESLIDLIAGPGGGVNASAGGGPFTAARTIARLGQPTRFLGHFSADPFGQLLTAKLAQDGVELALPDPVPEPTALAIVALDGQGVAKYWFHVAQTATFLLDQATARQALQADVTALHIGSVGLVVDPMASELERLAHDLPPEVLLLLDPNWRPQAIPDADAHRARIRRILPRTDILKTSTEDLSFLMPGHGIAEAARILLGWGTASRKPRGSCSAGAPVASWSPTGLRRFTRSPAATSSPSRSRRSRWWTRSALATLSAGRSWPGGPNAGWPGRTWPTPRKCWPP